MPMSMMALGVHYLSLGSAPSLMPWRRKTKRTSIAALGLITHFYLIYLYRTTPLDPFIKASRWIARSQDPFTNFYSIFHFMLSEDDESRSGDPEVDGLGQSVHCTLCILNI
jgi:hypothetical protein